MRLFSPAKINIDLKVDRVVVDGYHRVKTEMQAIDFGDILTIDLIRGYVSQSDILTCSDRSIPTDESNLVVKALNSFREISHYSSFFRIHILKNIPVGAGLGGGSSNAATAIFGANHLTGRSLTKNQIQEIAQRVGSDVSFFLASNGRAICRGRGELVTELPTFSQHFILFTFPSVNCETRRVYDCFDNLAESVDRLNVDAVNDLTCSAMMCYPELKNLVDKETKKGLRLRMTGSGSAHFCLDTDEARIASVDRDITSRRYYTESIFKTESGWYDITHGCGFQLGRR
jgi:4-diphosphocytidyl-2-C-methyl-D-erythritol kinase